MQWRSIPDFEIQRPESTFDMMVDKEIEPGLFLRISTIQAICRTISYQRNPRAVQRSETFGLSVFSFSVSAIIGRRITPNSTHSFGGRRIGEKFDVELLFSLCGPCVDLLRASSEFSRKQVFLVVISRSTWNRPGPLSRHIKTCSGPRSSGPPPANNGCTQIRNSGAGKCSSLVQICQVHSPI